jgi:hypothetical protein
MVCEIDYKRDIVVCHLLALSGLFPLPAILAHPPLLSFVCAYDPCTIPVVFAHLAVRAPALACNRAVGLHGLCIHVILMAHASNLSFNKFHAFAAQRGTCPLPMALSLSTLEATPSTIRIGSG